MGGAGMNEIQNYYQIRIQIVDLKDVATILMNVLRSHRVSYMEENFGKCGQIFFAGGLFRKKKYFRGIIILKSMYLGRKTFPKSQVTLEKMESKERHHFSGIACLALALGLVG